MGAPAIYYNAQPRFTPLRASRSIGNGCIFVGCSCGGTERATLS
jgi:hypothetical protein